jgi:hypothetical protein
MNGSISVLESQKEVFIKVFDGADAFETIVDVIKKHCVSNNQLNKVRNALAGGLTITLSSTKQKKRKSNKTEKMIV